MHRRFVSKGCAYDAEILHYDNSDLVRFYEGCKEQYGEELSDLIIATPSYGYLLIQYVGDGAVLTGTLNEKYFKRDMLEDIMDFLAEQIPTCRNIYLPYHIDWVSTVFSEEYNGEY